MNELVESPVARQGGRGFLILGARAMKTLRRILLAIAVCAPILLGSIGCGPKVYVDEEVKADSTTGTIKSVKEKEVKE